MSRLSMLSAAAAVIVSPAPSLAQSQPSQPIPRANFLKDMDVQFRKMDANGDARVTRPEMEQFRRRSEIAEAQARNRQMFARLDADRNGQISPAEFAKMVAALPPPNVEPAIAKFDLNKDQAISLVEYRTGTLSNFDRLDVDKDGYVSAPEMSAGGIGN